MSLLEFSSSIKKRGKILNEIIEHCQFLLNTAPEAREAKDYLESRLPLHITNQYKFGWFPPNQHLNLLSSAVSIEKLHWTKLVYEQVIWNGSTPTNEEVSILTHHNLFIPHYNLYNIPIALAGRCLLSKEKRKELKIGKYKNTPFSKTLQLFNLENAKEHIFKCDSVIIVEGQIDCLALVNAGIKNVVALAGSAFSFYHLSLILRYTTKIYLLLDGDKAGRTSVEKILKNYGSFADFEDIDIGEEYNDPWEYLQSNKFDLI